MVSDHGTHANGCRHHLRKTRSGPERVQQMLALMLSMWVLSVALVTGRTRYVGTFRRPRQAPKWRQED